VYVPVNSIRIATFIQNSIIWNNDLFRNLNPVTIPGPYPFLALSLLHMDERYWAIFLPVCFCFLPFAYCILYILQINWGYKKKGIWTNNKYSNSTVTSIDWGCLRREGEILFQAGGNLHLVSRSRTKNTYLYSPIVLNSIIKYRDNLPFLYMLGWNEMEL
jgi:hypothetical protein